MPMLQVTNAELRRLLPNAGVSNSPDSTAGLLGDASSANGEGLNELPAIGGVVSALTPPSTPSPGYPSLPSV